MRTRLNTPVGFVQVPFDVNDCRSGGDATPVTPVMEPPVIATFAESPRPAGIPRFGITGLMAMAASYQVSW